jgi:mannosyltransferase OCH1-like enzyme
MIPKIIHYCWLSGDPIPEDYKRCMATWKQKLPDYEIMLWDTKRFDIDKTVWTRQAFDTCMYACASDYIRLYAVYHYGGIYLDMEVIKPFDPLLDSEIMLADETPYQKSLEAGCFGAVKGHPYIKKCMEYFENNCFFDPAETENILNMQVSKRYIYISTLILPEIMKYILELFFHEKKYKIYPWEYFTAKNVMTGVIEKTRNTYTIHHFATQYHSEEWRKNRSEEQKIYAIFGEKTLLAKVVFRLREAVRRVKKRGFFASLGYYTGKYILHNRKWERIDL